MVRLPVVDIEKCNKIKQLSHYNFTKGNQICVGGVAGKGESEVKFFGR